MVALRAVEDLGATVAVVEADVGDLSQMSGAFEQLRNSHPPVRGIVHAAGVLRAQPLGQMEFETLQLVMRPKVTGTWILHRLTQGMALDFFIMFSSGASVWGSRELAHYAAANQFLDAMAHYRRRLGLPALSINWARWAGDGMTSEEDHRWLGDLGVEAMEADQGLAALGHLLQTGIPQSAVAKVNWSQFKPVYEAKARRPLLDQIDAGPTERRDRTSREGPELSSQLESTEPEHRHRFVELYLRKRAAKVLGLSSSEVDLHEPLNTQGLDSLMAVQLRNQVQLELGVTLPVSRFIESYGVTVLTEQLLREFEAKGTIENEPRARQKDATGLLADLDEMSDDDVDTLLTGLMSKRSA
jgi:acyl carrier protein